MKKAVRLLEAGLFVFLSLPLAVLPLRWSLEAGQFLGLLVSSYFEKFDSMDKLWLAFIVLEKYERKWNDGKWL